MKYLLLPTTIFVSIWSVVHGFQPFTSTQLQLATNAKVVLSKSCLNLFFIDFTNKKKRVASNDKEEEEEEELLEPSSLQDEKDLSAFLTSLGQWPLYPSAAAAAAAASSSSSSLEEATQISPRSLQRTNLNNNPLANILRLEVILDLAAGLKVNETESYFSSILATADRLFQQTTTSGKPPKVKETTELDLLTTVEDILECQEEDDDSQWLLDSIPLDGFPTNTLARLSFTQSNTISSSSSSAEPPNFGKAAESFVKDATSRMEYLFNETSKGLLTPTILQDLLLRSTQVFANTTSVEQLSNEIVHVAEEIAKSRGLSAPSAAERAREATRGAANMVTVANGLLTSGYAYGSLSGVSGSEEEVVEGGGLLSPTSNDNNNSVASSKPLFADFETARRVEPLEYPWVVQKGAEMGTLAGAIYEDNFEGCHKLDHSLVANGTTANVAWMVTDSMDTMSSFYEHKHDGPLMVRTLTIRGFDASDGTVDREWVLNAICTAAAEPISTETSDIHFHSGLLGIAKDLYKELKPYIEWTSPRHKIVLNGHVSYYCCCLFGLCHSNFPFFHSIPTMSKL